MTNQTGAKNSPLCHHKILEMISLSEPGAGATGLQNLGIFLCDTRARSSLRTFASLGDSREILGLDAHDLSPPLDVLRRKHHVPHEKLGLRLVAELRHCCSPSQTVAALDPTPRLQLGSSPEAYRVR